MIKERALSHASFLEPGSVRGDLAKHFTKTELQCSCPAGFESMRNKTNDRNLRAEMMSHPGHTVLISCRL